MRHFRDFGCVRGETLWRYVDVVLDSAWFLDPVVGPQKIVLVDCCRPGYPSKQLHARTGGAPFGTNVGLQR